MTATMIDPTIEPTIAVEELVEAEARLAALEARIGPVRASPVVALTPTDPAELARAFARLHALEARAGLRQDRNR